jgi:hypothetical protein
MSITAIGPSYGISAKGPETNAARGLRAALARNAARKAGAAATAPAAPITPTKPKARTWIPPKTEAEKARFATANGRVLAVMQHPAFASHSKLAAKLLGNAKLSAKEIGTILDIAAADTPAAQESAFASMQAALAEARANAGGTPIASPASGSAALWDRAIAKVFGAEEMQA